MFSWHGHILRSAGLNEAGERLLLTLCILAIVVFLFSVAAGIGENFEVNDTYQRETETRTSGIYVCYCSFDLRWPTVIWRADM